MKAKEMIYQLKVKEAQLWEKVKTREALSTLMCNTPNQDEWDDTHKRLMERYISEWYSISELLKEFGIEPFGFLERKELKEKNIIK